MWRVDAVTAIPFSLAQLSAQTNSRLISIIASDSGDTGLILESRRGRAMSAAVDIGHPVIDVLCTSFTVKTVH